MRIQYSKPRISRTIPHDILRLSRYIQASELINNWNFDDLDHNIFENYTFLDDKNCLYILKTLKVTNFVKKIQWLCLSNTIGRWDSDVIRHVLKYEDRSQRVYHTQQCDVWRYVTGPDWQKYLIVTISTLKYPPCELWSLQYWKKYYQFGGIFCIFCQIVKKTD